MSASKIPSESVLLITPETAPAIMAALRYHEDMAIWNDLGEHVWLKGHYGTDGKRMWLEDCCFVDDPCPRHAALQSQEEPPEVSKSDESSTPSTAQK